MSSCRTAVAGAPSKGDRAYRDSSPEHPPKDATKRPTNYTALLWYGTPAPRARRDGPLRRASKAKDLQPLAPLATPWAPAARGPGTPHAWTRFARDSDGRRPADRRAPRRLWL